MTGLPAAQQEVLDRLESGHGPEETVKNVLDGYDLAPDEEEDVRLLAHDAFRRIRGETT